MDEQNRPTPIRRRLTLTQTVQRMLSPTDLALSVDMKARNLDLLLQYSAVTCTLRSADAKSDKIVYRAAGTNGRLDLSLFWQGSEDPLKRPCNIWSGSKDPG